MKAEGAGSALDLSRAVKEKMGLDRMFKPFFVG